MFVIVYGYLVICTYIEEEASDTSVFAALRGIRRPNNERRAAREVCVRQILNEYLDVNPTKAINKAYFDCVVGLKRRLKDHLERIMGTNDEGLQSFFGQSDSDGLYELRHRIAHGTHDVVSADDRLRIQRNVFAVEKLATRYTWEILHKALNIYNIGNARQASVTMNINNAVLSSREMYRGSVDIALLYT